MKFFRRNLLIFLFLIAVFGGCAGGVAAAEPSVTAYSAVVMDADTGAYYYAKDADTMRVPASMTKLMTAYVIFEALDSGAISKDSVVTVSAAAARVASTAGYSNVPLYQGEKYTVDTMLKLMMLPSACGACYAMAEYISGSESAFVARMNATAASIGMTADFTNCHGAIDHYVTARSMAILAYNFIHRHPGILNYTSLTAYTFKGVTYTNTNKFLASDYYAGVDGLKTGTSGSAGCCMTVTARQNGRRVITVVMHSTSSANRYADTRKLLDYGFEQIRASDAAAASATLTLSSARPQIRLGADFTVNATVTNVAGSFAASGGWTVNGATVATFGLTAMGNGTVVSHNFNLDAYSGTNVTVGFYLDLPGGQRQVTAVYGFSADQPCAFRDIDGHWAETEITSLKTLEVLNGYGDGSFRPSASITRAEFVTALVRAMASQGLLTVTAETSAFTDVQGTWAEKYVAIAADKGIVNGYGDDRFCPDQNITREEIAVILVRAFQLTAAQTGATSFADDSEIANWARPGVCAAAESGLLKGYQDNTFRPAANATRAECAALLTRALTLTVPVLPPAE